MMADNMAFLCELFPMMRTRNLLNLLSTESVRIRNSFLGKEYCAYRFIVNCEL